MWQLIPWDKTCVWLKRETVDSNSESTNWFIEMCAKLCLLGLKDNNRWVNMLAFRKTRLRISIKSYLLFTKEGYQNKWNMRWPDIRCFRESKKQSLMFDTDPRSGTTSRVNIKDKSFMEDVRSNFERDSRGSES